MIYFVIAVLVALMFAPVVSAVTKRGRKLSLLCNGLSFFSLMITLTGFFLATPAAAAGEEAAINAAVNAAASGINPGLGFLSAAIVMGLATIGSGIAIASAASAAIGATGENPKLFGKAIIFVGLGEAIPLYALVIAVMILGKI